MLTRSEGCLWWVWIQLTHWGLNKISTDFQMTFSNAFSPLESLGYDLNFTNFIKIQFSVLIVVGIGCGWTDDKPLPEPKMTQICVALWHHQATINWLIITHFTTVCSSFKPDWLITCISALFTSLLGHHIKYLLAFFDYFYSQRSSELIYIVLIECWLISAIPAGFWVPWSGGI